MSGAGRPNATPNRAAGAVIGVIVEGDGDACAAPILIERIAQTCTPPVRLDVLRPFKLRRGDIGKRGEVTKKVAEVLVKLRAKAGGASRPAGAILILFDADGDCAGELGPKVLGWAQAAAGSVPVAVTIANREYETWFLANAEGLTSHKCRESPESVLDAKARFKGMLDHPYSETLDQAKFTQDLDIAAARERSRSFDRCCRKVCELIGCAS